MEPLDEKLSSVLDTVGVSLGVPDEPLEDPLIELAELLVHPLGVDQLSVSVELSDIELWLLLDDEPDEVEPLGVERSLEPPPSGGSPVAQTGRYR